jgi:hypothetical protein
MHSKSRYMKRFLLLCSLIWLISCNDKPGSNSTDTSLTSQVSESLEGVIINKQVETDTIKKSIRAFVKGKIGEANITITYHSPAVRGRIIWGGLVPYNQVWVTGAHMATTIQFDSALEMNGNKVPAGKYALFTIPAKEKWTIILNQNWQQHLTDEYDAALDVLRFEVTPQQLPGPQERLRYYFDEAAGAIIMDWEHIRIDLPVSL